MPNAIGAIDANGQAWIVQTESPRSALLYETRNFIPRRRDFGRALGEAFGGVWRYVPGAGCRGGWSVGADSPDELLAILARTGIPVTVYVYSDEHPPSPELAATASAMFRNRSGYYDQAI